MKLTLYYICCGKQSLECYTDKMKAEIKCQIMNDKAGEKIYHVEAIRVI